LNISVTHCAVFFFTGCFLPISYAGDSLCTPKETVFFSCKIKATEKLLSVCGKLNETFEASKPVANKDHYLQYRFGRVGNIELTFPEMKSGSLDKFEVTHDYRQTAGTTTYELSFAISNYVYRVYATNYPVSEGGNPIFDTFGGVHISKKAKRGEDLMCDDTPVNLIPDIELHIHD